MRITIVGTGAMACLFAARLAIIAPHATTLVGTWPDGLAALRRRGVVVVDEQDTHSYPVQAWPLGYPVQPAEIVLVLVKAWQTAPLATYIPNLLKPGGAVVSLQHSLGNLELLGPHACLGVTELTATLLEPGYVRAAGERPTFLAAPDWVVEVFRHAGFDVEGVPAERAAGLLWGALAVRCGLEALGAILHVPYFDLLKRPDALMLMDRAATECAMVAWAQNLTLPFADPMFAVRHAAEAQARQESPMLRDLRRGMPTEIDAVNGAVAQVGFQFGVHTTVNEVLWRQVRALAAPAASSAR
jgi:2-dehydropantoate 2-reductase